MAVSSLGRNVLFAIILLNTFFGIDSGVVHATQIMRRPATYKNTAKTFSIEAAPRIITVAKREEDESVNHTAILDKRATGKASFAYFTNWGIYGANFRM
jgi:chitinase